MWEDFGVPVRVFLVLSFLAVTAAADDAAQLRDQLKLGTELQQAGKFNLAITTLLNVRELAETTGHADDLAAIDNALGVAFTFTRQPKRAERSLNNALKLAQERGDEALQA